MSCLSSLPVDTIKIDCSLIRTITSSAETLSITRAIVAVAHGLGMKALAEGVENEGQLELLAANRCDQFQGHLFSAAIDADEMARILRDGRRIRVPQGRLGEVAKTILILDDEPRIVNRLSEQLGWRFGSAVLVETCVSGNDALLRLRRGAVDVVISDLRMPGCDGMDFLARARGIQPDLVCLMLVEPGEIHTLLDDARQLQVFRYLSKPWDLDLLLRHVEAALAHAVQLGSERLVVEAALLAHCSAPPEARGPLGVMGAPSPIDVVDRSHLGEVLIPQSLPTMPGDLWALARH